MQAGQGQRRRFAHRVLGWDLGRRAGVSLVGLGLECRGLGLGAARALLLSPSARGSAGGAAPARVGIPAPGAADGSVPHGPAPPPGQRSPRPPGHLPPPPPPRAMEPSRPGRQGGAGQTHGPADRRTTALPPPSRATAPRRGRPGRRARARAPAAPASSAPARAARHSTARPCRWPCAALPAGRRSRGCPRPRRGAGSHQVPPPACLRDGKRPEAGWLRRPFRSLRWGLASGPPGVRAYPTLSRALDSRSANQGCLLGKTLKGVN